MHSDSFCHLFLTGHEPVAMHGAAGLEATYIPSCDEKATTDPRVAKRIGNLLLSTFAHLFPVVCWLLYLPSPVVIYSCWTGLNRSHYQANAAIVAELLFPLIGKLCKSNCTTVVRINHFKSIVCDINKVLLAFSNAGRSAVKLNLK